jgi:cyclopropane fatty-acyl-phospholipid synthase-like methyltransferase
VKCIVRQHALITIGATTNMDYDKRAYDHWDTNTPGGLGRLSHLEIHSEQLSLMQKYLNQDMSILDLGCGTNLYKKHYPNILGVDVIDHPNVDVRSSILEFESEQKFDAVLSLGSIQYYDYKYIHKCFTKMVDLVKSDGLIVFRALYREPTSQYGHLIFWDKNMIERLTKENNLDIIHPLTTYPLKDRVDEKFDLNAPELMNMTLIWRKL